MTQQNISTIYRSSHLGEPKTLDPWPKSRLNWGERTIIGKVKLGYEILKEAASHYYKEKDDAGLSVDSFVLVSVDGSQKVFPYGHARSAPDNEAQALQKAIQSAFSEGLSANEKSISMFANGKIDKLVLVK